MDDYKQHWEVVNYGKPIAINEPDDLWFMACTYYKWCDEHTLNGVQRPYNIKGLCLHCGISEEYLRDLRGMKDKDSLWHHVVSRILYVIYVQNVELATVGEYNSVFIAKLYKIDGEEQESGTIKIEMVGNVPKLAQNEAEILEKMNLGNVDLAEDQS
jgi:hypothetical protein